MINQYSLLDLAKNLNGEVFGNKNLTIDNIGSISRSNSRSIVFLTKKNLQVNAIKFNYGALLLDKTSPIEYYEHSNAILVDDSKVAFAKMCSLFKTPLTALSKPKTRDIDKVTHGSNFSISDDVVFGDNLQVGSNVVIESGVKIGNNCVLGNNVVIGFNTTIGDSTVIDSGTIIGSEGFGNFESKSKKWIHIEHIGSVIIGNNVMIGANCCIDRGTIDETVISDGVIIDNLVHIAHNVFIGKDTAIAAKVGIAGSCKIGERNKIGGLVGIIDHIVTANDVTISATSTVNKNLSKAGIYTGIMPITEHSLWKRIAHWITKLDKITKFLNIRKI